MPKNMEPSKPKNYFHRIISTKQMLICSIIFLILIAIDFFFISKGINEFLKDCMYILGIFATISGVWFVAIGLNIQYSQNKLQNTFSLIREYDKIKQNIHKDDPINLQKYNKVLDESVYNNLIDKYSLYNSIKERFNYFEDLSIAIQYEYIEEEIAFNSLKGIVIRHYNLYFVEQTYKYMNLKDSEFSYLNAKLLYNSWKDSKSLITKKDILIE